VRDRGIGGWLATRELKSPDRAALIQDDVVTTYRELSATAERFAGALRDRGLGRGDRIAYLGENHPAFVAALFGTALSGATFVPINTRLAPPEIEHILRDSGARLLVVEEHLALNAQPALDALPEVARVVIGTASTLPNATTLEEFLAAERESFDEPISLDDPAAILYTSGTTGRPKGAVLSHGNLTWNAINSIIDVDFVSADIALMISPLFHAASLGMGLLPIILKGGTVVLERQFDPGRALALIEKHRVTALSGVPTTYQFLADHPDWPTTDLSSLAKLTSGGSAAPSRTIEAFEARGLAFSQGYGMTEASPGATFLPAHRTREKLGSSGLPMFFTDVRVVDEQGEPVPVGEVGEIQVAGPNVFSGYHGLPDASAAALTADGWFRSGDLGYLDDEGYLYVADRVKDMIISGGENIYPAEVEDLIMSLPGVSGVAVIGVPDQKWGEVPWAVVTLAPGTELGDEQVRAALDGRVAKYKIPKHVVVIDILPRTASGKIRKVVLREMHERGELGYANP
jgi:fatty-acyl-CoA synthase